MMKKIIGLFLILCFAQQGFASTLIFKTTKTVTTDLKAVELATVDVSKYKKIRVAAKMTQGNRNLPVLILIGGLEDGEYFSLGEINLASDSSSNSMLIDVVPSKITITTLLSGTYKIYIWGE